MKKLLGTLLSVLMIVTCISFNTGASVYADITTYTYEYDSIGSWVWDASSGEGTSATAGDTITIKNSKLVCNVTVIKTGKEDSWNNGTGESVSYNSTTSMTIPEGYRVNSITTDGSKVTIEIVSATISTAYVNAKGVAQANQDCTPIVASTTTLGEDSKETWYVANDNVTVTADTLTVNGNVNLILADDKTLTLTNGIKLTEDCTLTIYGQSGKTGTLTTKYIFGVTGIGTPVGTFTINGGNLSASGYDATIYANTVNINGGNVTVSGDEYGIMGYTVKITGGTISASGANAGIMGYTTEISGGDISVANSYYGIYAATSASFSGGTVNSNCSNYGIYADGTINISSTVTAKGGTAAVSCNELNITGSGQINAYGPVVCYLENDVSSSPAAYNYTNGNYEASYDASSEMTTCTYTPADSTKVMVLSLSPSTPTGGSGNNNSGNTGDSNNKKVVNTSVK